MDIVFINPKDTFTPLPPLGLMIMCALARKNDYTATIVDAEIEKLSDAQLADMLKREKPAIVGVPIFTPTYSQALGVLRLVKSVDPTIKTVLGGAHATLYPEVLEKEDVDYVVRGEGEITFIELVDFILHGKGKLEDIKGISYKSNGKILHNPNRELIHDLDSLPWAARDTVPIEKYPGVLMPNLHPETQVMGTRGCPFKCAFCSNAIFGKSVRFRNAMNVVDEVEFLIEKYRIKSLFFYDDGLNYKADWLNTICDEFIKRGINEKIEWKGQVRVNKGFVNQEMLNKMHKAGCWMLAWGVESGNQTILNNIHKCITLGEVEAAMKMSSKAGIRNLGLFMAGNMTETKETVYDTIRFSKKLMFSGLDYLQWSIAIPYPGTEFYDVCKKNGWIKADGWEDWKDDKQVAIIDMPEMPQEWLQKTRAKAYKMFYMDPRYMAIQISKVRKFNDVKMLLTGLDLVKKAIQR